MAITPISDGKPWPLFRTLQGATAGDLSRDLAAGLTLAAIAIPEQMATARLGGLAPQLGLVAFVAATVAFVALGASRRMSAGADSTITPIFAGALAALAVVGSGHYGVLASTLALMVGAILVLAGVLRLGWIGDLLSQPVTTGFFAGVSLHIVVSQAPALLGLPEESGDLYNRLAHLFANASATRPAALAIGLAVFAVTFGADKLNPRFPGALIALVVATAAAAALGLARHGVAVLGVPPQGLPHPQLPGLSLATLPPLVGLALVIALVVMVQTAVTAREFSGADGEADVERDYIGVGAGGLLAGLFGAMPVNASPPRTAAVAAAGGRSGASGLAAAIAVLLLAAFGTRVLSQIPSAALAGILLFIALRIFHVGDFARILRRAPAEFPLAAGTTALIVLLPIQTGVAIGIFLSLVHGVYTITRARLIPFERAPGTTVWWPVSADHPGERAPRAIVLGFQAPLSFLNARAFRHDVVGALDRDGGEARLVVLEASGVVEIDFTAADALNEAIGYAHARKVDFAVARLESVRAQAAFRRFGVLDRLGPDHLFRSVEEAIRALAPASEPAPTPEVRPS
jgi:MFS superfamily sulfate permease-like transporter